MESHEVGLLVVHSFNNVDFAPMGPVVAQRPAITSILEYAMIDIRIY